MFLIEDSLIIFFHLFFSLKKSSPFTFLFPWLRIVQCIFSENSPDWFQINQMVCCEAAFSHSTVASMELDWVS